MGETTFYRITEQYYENMAAFEKAIRWVRENQISSSRGITTDFKFYVVCESKEIDIVKSKSY